MKTNRVRESNGNGGKFFLKEAILAAYIFIVASMLLMQPGSTQAMDRMGRGLSPEQIVSELKEHLGLTAEQEAQILPIIQVDIERHSEILKKDREQAPENRDAVRAELEAIDRETDAKLATILLAEQMKEFQKLRDERRTRMRDKPHRSDRYPESQP